MFVYKSFLSGSHIAILIKYFVSSTKTANI